MCPNLAALAVSGSGRFQEPAVARQRAYPNPTRSGPPFLYLPGRDCLEKKLWSPWMKDVQISRLCWTCLSAALQFLRTPTTLPPMSSGVSLCWLRRGLSTAWPTAWPSPRASPGERRRPAGDPLPSRSRSRGALSSFPTAGFLCPRLAFSAAGPVPVLHRP